MRDIGIQFQVGPEGAIAKQHEPRTRIRRWDQAKQKAVQFGSHMCAFNVLGPAYTRFEDQLDTIKRVVQAYLEEARPSKIEWIGQRFINAIELPIEISNISTYFPIYPQLPLSLNVHRPLALQIQTSNTNGNVS